MNPIISPLWFYLIGIGAGTQVLLEVVGGTIAVAAGIALIVSAIQYYNYNFESSILKIIKISKKYFMIGLMIGFFAELIPSKETCYQMIAATVVTPNNIKIVGETTTDIVDYIIESVDTLLEKEEEDKVSH